MKKSLKRIFSFVFAFIITSSMLFFSASELSNGQSLGWNLLSSSNSSVRQDVPTLNVVFNHPNYAFGVN